MPFPLLAPLIMAGGSLLGGLLGGRKRTNQTNYNNTSTNSTMPVETPGARSISDLIRTQIEGRLQNPTSLPQGYEEGGIRSINSVFDVLNQSKGADLTARGLGSSPIAGAVMDSGTNARGGEIAKFTSGLPLVQRELQNQDLGMAQGFYNSLPRGLTSTQTSSGTGAQTDPGNMAGGGLSGLAQMLGYLMGTGQLGGSRAPGAPTGFN